MKLAVLLANYLFTNKRLELPGLGTFVLDPMVLAAPENKTGKPTNLEGVTFENKPLIKEAPDLVQYISSQTGKIKALAAADLESHLGLAQQFLNIGNPFLFEGIGSLVKTRSGEFAFTSGLIMPDNMSAYSAREISSTSSTQESFSGYSSTFYTRKKRATWKRPLIFFLVLLGIGLAIWGGYTVYKKSSINSDEVPAEENTKVEKVLPLKDTSKKAEDSQVTSNAIPAIGERKFVLETASVERAFTRFAQLKTYQWAVQMETRDSFSFKLYLMLPAAAEDTSRMVDSLSKIYGRRVYIE